MGERPRGHAKPLPATTRYCETLIEDHGGYVFKTVGDAFCAAFPTAPDALEAALEAQRSFSGGVGGDGTS